MGFYGNIVNSNKAAFTFDKIYPNRAAMDRDCETDEVFLGRYVLVEYDNPPVKFYFDFSSGTAYVDSHHSQKINGQQGVIYQDILSGIFYQWDKNTKKWVEYKGSEPYAFNYKTDVDVYGRSYDSTAWLKRFDVDANGGKGKYTYVMVAELNTVVPQLHLLVEPPLDAPLTPYFDKESTNMDYYLHLSGDYQNRIQKAKSTAVSDEQVVRQTAKWTYNTTTGVEECEVGTETVDADIFYNKAGFNSNSRSYSNVEDTINYTTAASSRRYSNGIFAPHGKGNQPDIKDWFIRLPSIGNAVCLMWDAMYGEARNKNLSKSRGDSSALYDRDTTIGIINSLRDILGYTFKPLGSRKVGNRVTAEDTNLYYSSTTINGVEVPQKYYYYAYSPTFAKNTSGDYYLENGEYKLANKKVTATSDLYKLTKSWTLVELNAPSEDSMYGMIFTLHKLIGTGDNDSRDLETIRGCINRIKDIIDNIDTQLVPNRLMWTTSNGVIQTSNTQFPSASDDSTRVLTGAGNWENRVRKIKVNAGSSSIVDWQTNTGTIDTNSKNNNEIQFEPLNKWIGLNVDPNRQLIQISHSASELSAHKFKSDVVVTNLQDATKSECSYVLPFVITDNAGHVTGYENTTIYVPYVYKNFALKTQSTSVTNTSVDKTTTQSAANTNDTFSFATGNKWIRANIDNDTLTYGHLVQTIATSAPTSDLNASGTFKTEEYTYDEAGHIRSKATRTLTLPYNYKTIKVAQSAADTAITTNTGSIVAANQVDSYTIAAGNKWVQLAATNGATNDTITVAHSLQGTAGEYTGTDKTFTGFGDSVILYGYTTDNAGHVIANPTYTLTLPKGSLTDTASTAASDVLTSIGFVDTTGALTTTHQQLGTMLLTGYVYNATNTNQIAATDTLHSALSKVDAQIAKEITDRTNAINTLSTALNAADKTLQDNIDAEQAARQADIIDAKAYTDTQIKSLLGEDVPEALNTLKELSVALGEDKDFSATVTTMIGNNTTAIEAEQAKIDAHIADKNNPHGVTAVQLGLGNVTNENKATMFTNPAFTGVPTAPTADANSNSEQLANTAFVVTAITNSKEAIEQTIAAETKTYNELLTKEIDAREKADQIRHEEFTNAIAVEIKDRQDALEAMLQDLLQNYNVALNDPEFTVGVSAYPEEYRAELAMIPTKYLDDTFTVIWYKNQLEGDPIPVAETVQMNATEIGEYYCVVTRIHNNQVSNAVTSNIITLGETDIPPMPEPEIPTPENPEEPVNPDDLEPDVPEEPVNPDEI